MQGDEGADDVEEWVREMRTRHMLGLENSTLGLKHEPFFTNLILFLVDHENYFY